MKRKKPKRKKRIANLRENRIPYSKYRIEWFDIASDSGWASESQFDDMKLATPVSEGWLFSKDKDTVRIFAGYDVDDDGSIFLHTYDQTLNNNNYGINNKRDLYHFTTGNGDFSQNYTIISEYETLAGGEFEAYPS